MHKYLPHTEKDIEKMLEKIGVSSMDDLFAEIPDALKGIDLDLPESFSEIELREHFERLASQNEPLVPFMGAGAYDHYTPSVIPYLLERQEFMTAYTPYQPEVSQGTLQYIFEYQTMITELTGMDVSNASMYDGATATAEAMFMAVKKKRKKVLVAKTANPNVLNVLRTYAHPRDIEIVLVDEAEGALDTADLEKKLDAETAAFIVQTPNVYGVIENLEGVGDRLKENKSLFIINQDPSTLSHLKTPAEWGADIAVGDCQTLGVPLAYGGPYIGYMATTKKLMRQMPGRICGVTEDVDGKRAFVLTLQAREQHIRREKAKSNICSNQSLMALHVTIYLSLMGKKGLKEVQKTSYNHAHYLKSMLEKLPSFEDPFDKPFFKEFTLRTTLDPERINQLLREKGYLGPLSQGRFCEEKKNLVTFAVTEKRTKEQMDEIIRILGAI